MGGLTVMLWGQRDFIRMRKKARSFENTQNLTHQPKNLKKCETEYILNKTVIYTFLNLSLFKMNENYNLIEDISIFLI